MTAKPASEPKFEVALKDLEAAVERLEQGDLPLEEALGCFERGVKAAGRCQTLLKEVENRVECLLRDRGGDLHLEPFQDGGDD